LVPGRVEWHLEKSTHDAPRIAGNLLSCIIGRGFGFVTLIKLSFGFISGNRRKMEIRHFWDTDWQRAAWCHCICHSVLLAGSCPVDVSSAAFSIFYCGILRGFFFWVFYELAGVRSVCLHGFDGLAKAICLHLAGPVCFFTSGSAILIIGFLLFVLFSFVFHCIIWDQSRCRLTLLDTLFVIA
jgi:hypothetical protein